MTWLKAGALELAVQASPLEHQGDRVPSLSNMFDLGYGCGGREPGGPVQPSSMPPLQECSRQALTEINVRCRGFIHRIRAQEAGGNAPFRGFGRGAA